MENGAGLKNGILSVDDFLAIKDEYHGKLVEVSCGDRLFSAEVTRLQVEDNILKISARNLYVFKQRKWTLEKDEEGLLFTLMLCQENITHKGGGTLELRIREGEVVYLKLREPIKRA